VPYELLSIQRMLPVFVYENDRPRMTALRRIPQHTERGKRQSRDRLPDARIADEVDI